MKHAPFVALWSLALAGCHDSDDGFDVTAAFSATPPSGAAPLTVQFTDASSANVGQWEWRFDDGGFSFLPSPEHTFDAPGTYQVQLHVVSCRSAVVCEHDWDTQTITVTAAPQEPRSAPRAGAPRRQAPRPLLPDADGAPTAPSPCSGSASFASLASGLSLPPTDALLELRTHCTSAHEGRVCPVAALEAQLACAGRTLPMQAWHAAPATAGAGAACAAEGRYVLAWHGVSRGRWTVGLLLRHPRLPEPRAAAPARVTVELFAHAGGASVTLFCGVLEAAPAP